MNIYKQIANVLYYTKEKWKWIFYDSCNYYFANDQKLKTHAANTNWEQCSLMQHSISHNLVDRLFAPWYTTG